MQRYATRSERGILMSVLQRDPGDEVQILDEDGQVREGASVPDIDDDTLVEEAEA